MTDYISRDAASVEIKRFIGYLDEDMIERLQVAIRRIPAADVIPVEWIESQADFDKWNELVNRWNEYKEECK